MAADLYDAFSNEQRWVRPFLTRPGGVPGGLARLADYGGRLGRGIAGGLAGENQTPPPPQQPPQPPPPRPQQPPMQAPPDRGPQAMSQAQTSMTPASAPLPPVPREPPAASPMAQMAVAPQVAGTTADTPAPLSANRASSPGYGGGAGDNDYRTYLQRKVQSPGADYTGNVPIYRGVDSFRDEQVRASAMAALQQMDENSPERQLALFDQLAANPRRLGVYLAGRGQDPNIARTIPQSTEAGGPGYNIGNLEQAATDPELAYLHQAMGPESGLNLGQKLDLASKFMETGNPKYRDYTKAWLQRQQATNEAWQRDVQSIQPRTAGQINLRGPLELLGGLTGRDRSMELARNERARQVMQMFPQLFAPTAMAGTLGGY